MWARRCRLEANGVAGGTSLRVANKGLIFYSLESCLQLFSPVACRQLWLSRDLKQFEVQDEVFSSADCLPDQFSSSCKYKIMRLFHAIYKWFVANMKDKPVDYLMFLFCFCFFQNCDSSSDSSDSSDSSSNEVRFEWILSFMTLNSSKTTLIFKNNSLRLFSLMQSGNSQPVQPQPLPALPDWLLTLLSLPTAPPPTTTQTTTTTTTTTTTPIPTTTEVRGDNG